MDEQRGLVKCDACGRWFRSRGGLAVHRCSPEEVQSAAQRVAYPGYLKRRVEREKPVENRAVKLKFQLQ